MGSFDFHSGPLGVKIVTLVTFFSLNHCLDKKKTILTGTFFLYFHKNFKLFTFEFNLVKEILFQDQKSRSPCTLELLNESSSERLQVWKYL